MGNEPKSSDLLLDLLGLYSMVITVRGWDPEAQEAISQYSLELLDTHQVPALSHCAAVGVQLMVHLLEHVSNVGLPVELDRDGRDELFRRLVGDWRTAVIENEAPD